MKAERKQFPPERLIESMSTQQLFHHPLTEIVAYTEHEKGIIEVFTAEDLKRTPFKHYGFQAKPNLPPGLKAPKWIRTLFFHLLAPFSKRLTSLEAKVNELSELLAERIESDHIQMRARQGLPKPVGLAPEARESDLKGRAQQIENLVSQFRKDYEFLKILEEDRVSVAAFERSLCFLEMLLPHLPENAPLPYFCDAHDGALDMVWRSKTRTLIVNVPEKAVIRYAGRTNEHSIGSDIPDDKPDMGLIDWIMRG